MTDDPHPATKLPLRAEDGICHGCGRPRREAHDPSSPPEPDESP